MTPPKVSIIIPNYNHERFLKQRLETVFNQTFQDFEVIILDDCSTDNSRDIIQEYYNKVQVSHIVYNEKNSGSPFKQWAKGLQLAKGEYIWIAESDDWAELNFVNELIPFFSSENKPDLVFCHSLYEYEDHVVNKPLVANSGFIDKDILLKNYFCWNPPISNASAALIKKSIAISIPSYYQTFFGSGDYFFWVQYIEKSSGIYYVNKPLNHCRQHEFNTTAINKKTGRMYLENLYIHRYLYQKRYISFFQKQVIVLGNLEAINSLLERTSSGEENLIKAKICWEKEIISKSLSKIIVFFGKKIWHLFNS